MNADNKRLIMQYLDDVNDSAHYSGAYLRELIIEAFALTDAEARQVYREWVTTE
jgi:hypothetical protein